MAFLFIYVSLNPRMFLKKEKRHVIDVSFFLEAPPRLELGIKVLQTSALPLGYGAL